MQVVHKYRHLVKYNVWNEDTRDFVWKETTVVTDRSFILEDQFFLIKEALGAESVYEEDEGIEEWLEIVDV